MNFWRKPRLFSLRAVGSRENRTVKVHFFEVIRHRIKGRISFYCSALEVSRQAFYDYLDRKDKPWKYASLVEEMLKILGEDEYNDCYGRERMYMALLNKKEAGEIDIDIPCDSTVRNVMEENGLIHKVRRKPNGITKADREAHKSDDLIKRDFSADKPLEKAVTDISELKGSDGKVYVSAVFDCFDLMPLGLAIEDNAMPVSHSQRKHRLIGFFYSSVVLSGSFLEWVDYRPRSFFKYSRTLAFVRSVRNAQRCFPF